MWRNNNRGIGCSSFFFGIELIIGAIICICHVLEEQVINANSQMSFGR